MRAKTLLGLNSIAVDGKELKINLKGCTQH
jgi:hypothetical protein